MIGTIIKLDIKRSERWTTRDDKCMVATIEFPKQLNRYALNLLELSLGQNVKVLDVDEEDLKEHFNDI